MVYASAVKSARVRNPRADACVWRLCRAHLRSAESTDLKGTAEIRQTGSGALTTSSRAAYRQDTIRVFVFVTLTCRIARSAISVHAAQGRPFPLLREREPRGETLARGHGARGSMHGREYVGRHSADSQQAYPGLARPPQDDAHLCPISRQWQFPRYEGASWLAPFSADICRRFSVAGTTRLTVFLNYPT